MFEAWWCYQVSLIKLRQQIIHRYDGASFLGSYIEGFKSKTASTGATIVDFVTWIQDKYCSLCPQLLKAYIIKGRDDCA